MSAVAASPLPTTYVDRTGVYRFVNKAYERWFGQTADKVVGRTLADVLGSKAAESTEVYVKTALDGGTVEFESSLAYSRRGARRVRMVFAPAREADGRIPGFFVYIEDITVRYDAEAAVAAALDGLADGYVALDRNLRFTYVNSAAARLYGLTREEMLERSIDELFPGSSDSAPGRLVREVLQTRNPQRQELPSAGRPGQVFRFDVVPLMTGGVAAVIQDVSGTAET
ncbi:PAS domain-containing protein [Phenylobacterium sp. J426]|uniref:PAS domain-containing protein n=1 Tax=Phenylobacterium sp. J426 TaxID=2898439 RepID=UPI00215084CE|nr:PAS domain-containing protein [Phenylobacterium sp. J426]MCR5875530.1 PAS domain-containing protein [Phenylobacterium sp. J426]